VVSLLGGGAAGDVIQVPEDAKTLAQAIAMASDGDVVDIAGGTWAGGVDLQGKAIVLRGRSPGRTILTGVNLSMPVISCITGENAGTVLEDLIIRDGTGRPVPGFPGMTIGGGLLCEHASPTVRRCRFERNKATLSGGAVYCGPGADVLFEACTFSNNEAEKGGAIISVESSPRFIDCSFESNRASFAGGAFFAADGSEPVIQGGAFIGNVAGFTGGGLYEYDARTLVSDVVFDRNRASIRGGAAYMGHRSRGELQRCHFKSPTDEVAGSSPSLYRPPIRGGCALDEWCIVSEESDCLLAGGLYLGDHVACDSLPRGLVERETGDLDRDGIIDDRDLALLMLLWR
jgi:predicted outer membrane repeat protein